MSEHATLEKPAKTTKKTKSEHTADEEANSAYSENNKSTKNFCQNYYFETLCNRNALLSVYLVNGIKLQGNIIAFDEYSIVLDGKTTQIVYKHAICSILPEETS